jgi:hypothetical protein
LPEDELPDLTSEQGRFSDLKTLREFDVRKRIGVLLEFLDTESLLERGYFIDDDGELDEEAHSRIYRRTEERVRTSRTRPYLPHNLRPTPGVLTKEETYLKDRAATTTS